MSETTTTTYAVFETKGAPSWVLYDVANTVYAATLTFIAAPYAERVLGASTQIGIVNTISMAAAGVAVPVMAALADKTGKARRYLTIFTLACIVSLAMFGISSSLAVFLIAFGVANFTYNSALVFYNSLLPSVCPPTKAGLISGLGVGLGYAGTLATVLILLPFADGHGERPTFVLAAVLFLVLSLPCMIRVRDRRPQQWEPFSGHLLKSRFSEVGKTLRGLRQDKPMAWFLVGNFLCVDVLNTSVLYFSIFVVNVATGLQFSLLWADFDMRVFVVEGSGATVLPSKAAYMTLMGATLNVAALAFGVVIGRLADRIEALKVMRISSACLMGALLLAFFLAPRTVGDGFDKRVKEAVEAKELAALSASESLVMVADSAAVAEVERELAERETRMAALGSSSSPSEPSPKVGAVLAAEQPWPPLASNAFFLAFVVLGSAGLAGIWTAGRKVLLELAPQARVGEYFGLYGITVKLSVIGSTTFALIWWISDVRMALAFQAIPLGFGIICLWMTSRLSRARSTRSAGPQASDPA